MDGIEELSGHCRGPRRTVPTARESDSLQRSSLLQYLINQDSALMRPGRLDRILFVGAPDLETRKDIFRVRFSIMSVEPGIDVEELAYL
jgi:SpoVK/Ycf46/Vps4 family AAA+-type ATPase